MENIDEKVVSDFGNEWLHFDQKNLSDHESKEIFHKYFSLLDLEENKSLGSVVDFGCGSGRWAYHLSDYCEQLIAIDPSSAVISAESLLKDCRNVEVRNISIENFSLIDGEYDFGYSLGVLHHIPNTEAAMASCVKKIRSGGKFLVYLYYAFDNRPIWFRLIWKCTELVRLGISPLPFSVKVKITNCIALFVYWPAARISKFLQKYGLNVENIPLSAYKDCSFFTMRTDALDRFGTKLEQRFSKAEIQKMMESAGLENIKFREGPGAPYWVAIGTKK